MKKTLIMCMLGLSVVIAGCQSDLEPKKQESKDWNIDMDYSMLQNSYSVMRNMLLTEDEIFVFPSVEGEKGIGFLSTYLHNEELKLLNNNLSSSCSIKDPDACSNFYYNGEVFTYYMGKLYYISTDYDISSDSSSLYLYRSDLDGQNRQKIYELKSENSYDNVAAFIACHKNNIYLNYDGKLFIGNIDNLRFKESKIKNVKDIQSLFFDRDKMYVTVGEYENNGELYFDAVLICDLEGNIIGTQSKDKKTYFIDDKLHFYLNEGSIMVENRETKEVKKVHDGYGTFFFKHDNLYLVDTVPSTNGEKPVILLLDDSGNILSKKELSKDENHVAQIFTGKRLYVSKGGNRFGYYEISGDSISDYKEVIDIESEE